MGSAMGGAETTERLKFIDGLRGLAVLMVILSHSAQGLGPGSFKFTGISHFVSAGDRGVQLFFILSAFTLFKTSLIRYKTDKLPTLSFYLRRAFRILPFWWLIVIYWSSYNGISPLIMLMSGFFIFGFFRFIPKFELVPGGWTLFVEETFYIFLPLIYRFIKTIWGALSLLLGLLVLRQLWLSVAPLMPILQNNHFIELAPPAQWFAFGIGICLYFIYTNSVFQKKTSQTDFAIMLDFLAIFAIYSFLGDDIVASSFALAVMFIASINSNSIFGKITRLSIIQKFGIKCYSIYLLQFVVFLQLNPVMHNLFERLGVQASYYEIRLLIYFPIVCAVLYILSSISFAVIEKPCINAGKKLIAKLNKS
jgi:peptidoglycan/LPS O-acetylase OafA/YrhL